MINHAQTAKELFLQGYNCSQSVVAAFCDETGLDVETSLKISSSFGAGMGKLREVCGAVSGVFMVLGLLYGYSNPDDFQTKTELYERVQLLGNQFKTTNGSFICRELLGLSQKEESSVPEQRTKAYYKKRPCAELVEQAAELLDEYIAKNKLEEIVL
jgi:C_GCAxxG_C_C family probable redox protein